MGKMPVFCETYTYLNYDEKNLAGDIQNVKVFFFRVESEVFLLFPSIFKYLTKLLTVSVYYFYNQKTMNGILKSIPLILNRLKGTPPFHPTVAWKLGLRLPFLSLGTLQSGTNNGQFYYYLRQARPGESLPTVANVRHSPFFILVPPGLGWEGGCISLLSRQKGHLLNYFSWAFLFFHFVILVI